MKYFDIPNKNDFLFPDEWVTLQDLIFFRSQKKPDQDALIYYKDLTNKTVISNHELAKKIKIVGNNLSKLSEPGSRVLILAAPSLEYVITFLGAVAAGLIPVPCYPPFSKKAASTLNNIIKNCTPTVMIIDANLQGKISPGKLMSKIPFGTSILKKIIGDEFVDFLTLTKNIVSTESLFEINDYEGFQPFLSNINDPIFLMYTSGSTGSPKGVVITHKNLQANFYQIISALNFTKNTHFVNWIPPYHDMGLIGAVLLPLFFNTPSTLFSPIDFLKDPLLWIELINMCDGEVMTGAPNFAYDLSVKRYDENRLANIDLSNWRYAINSAEPLHKKTIESFIKTYGDHGFKSHAFYPSYGLAEATLHTTGNFYNNDDTILLSRHHLKNNKIHKPVSSKDTYEAVSSGLQGKLTEIFIVDPLTKEILPENEIGEIWIRGSCISDGYWRNSEESRKAFSNRLEKIASPLLATGDYGFLKNHKLYVTGRIKDMMCIHGKNIYPHDIEFLIRDLSPLIRKGGLVAFSVVDEQKEKMALIIETNTEDEKELKKLAQMIREEISESHQLTAEWIYFTGPRTLSKTSSGKIQRSMNKQRLLDGSMPVIYTSTFRNKECPTSMDQIGDYHINMQNILHIAANHLDDSPENIATNTPLVNLGFDSIEVVNFIGDLEKIFDKEIDINQLNNKLSLEKLAKIIDSSPKKQQIDQKKHQDELPTTRYQKELFLLNKSRKNNSSLVVPLCIKTYDKKSFSKLIETMDSACKKSEALNSTFKLINDDLYMSINKQNRTLPLERVDATHEKDNHIEAFINKPFDLENDVPIRVLVIEKKNEEREIIIALHHIIGDLQSILSILHGCPGMQQLSPFITYKKSIERDVKKGTEILDEQLKDSRISPLNGPEPIDSKNNQDNRVESFNYEIDSDISKQLEQASKKYSTTVFSTMLAVIGIEDAQRKGSGTKSIGVAINPRRKSEWIHLVGAIAEPKICLLSTKDNESIKSYLENLSGSIDLLTKMPLTYADQIQHARKSKNATINPNLIFSYAGQMIQDDILDTKCTIHPVSRTEIDTPLFLTMYKKEGKYQLFVEYKNSIYSEGSLRQWISNILKQVDVINNQSVIPTKHINKKNIRVSATFSLDYVKSAFENLIEKSPWEISLNFADYAQVLHELHNPESDQADTQIYYIRLEDATFYKQTDNPKECIQSFVNELVEALKNRRSHVILVLTPTQHKDEVNRIQNVLKDFNHIQIITESDIDTYYPIENKEDEFLLEKGHIPYTKEYSVALSYMAVRVLASKMIKQPKVIAVDCDNTLWTGLAGEDKFDKLKLSDGQKKLQESLKRAANSGILICLTSKNIESDVIEIFKNRQDFPLQLSDVTAHKVNWNNKAENLIELAKELNLGLDSFVFIDDNPCECAEVQDILPEVLTIQAPNNDENLKEFVESLWLLDVWKTNTTDKNRKDLYKNEHKRSKK